MEGYNQPYQAALFIASKAIFMMIIRTKTPINKGYTLERLRASPEISCLRLTRYWLSSLAGKNSRCSDCC